MNTWLKPALAVTLSFAVGCSATADKQQPGKDQSSLSSPPGIDFQITESEDTCATGPIYRFSVVNGLSSTIRELLVVLSPPEGMPGDRVFVLCPGEAGSCSARVLQSDAVGSLNECKFILSPDDDFACRVGIAATDVHATLSGAIDSGGSLSATADVSSSLHCEIGGAQASFTSSCGGDPEYRFEVRNTGTVTLRDLRILTDVSFPVPTVSMKLCPDGNGGCSFVTVDSDATNQHPECNFVLSPGDDFACRINLEPTTVNAQLLGTGDNGEPVLLSTTASCAPPTLR